jgi:hypothetical protein
MERISTQNLFDKELNDIRLQRRELAVQEQAQLLIQRLHRACVKAGMGACDDLNNFASSTLGEFAIIAVRNNIKVEAFWDDPKKRKDEPKKPVFL